MESHLSVQAQELWVSFFLVYLDSGNSVRNLWERTQWWICCLGLGIGSCLFLHFHVCLLALGAVPMHVCYFSFLIPLFRYHGYKAVHNAVGFFFHTYKAVHN